MRKLVTSLLILAMFLTVCGCGESKTSISAKPGNIGNDVAGISNKEDKEDGFIYTVNDAGNHPNNLYQNQDHTIAFDDNYIYFTNYYGSNYIYRSDHSGNNVELFYTPKRCVYSLNCYKGNLYYYDDNNKLGKTIVKVNTSTKAAKKIYTLNENETFYNVFVAADCVFYSLYSKDTDTTTVYATSCDGEGLVVLTTEKGGRSNIELFFTKDDKNLYILEARDEGQENVTAFPLENIKNAIKTSGTVSGTSSYFPRFGRKYEWMLGANGILDFECGWTTQAESRIYFQGFKYAKENGNPDKGSKTAMVKISETTKPKLDYVVPFGSKWVIGNSIINVGQNDLSHLGQCVDDDGTYPIYIYKDGDISKETKVLSLPDAHFELSTGSYKDKLYLICYGEDNKSRENSCLYVFDENGIVTQTNMIIPTE